MSATKIMQIECRSTKFAWVLCRNIVPTRAEPSILGLCRVQPIFNDVKCSLSCAKIMQIECRSTKFAWVLCRNIVPTRAEPSILGLCRVQPIFNDVKCSLSCAKIMQIECRSTKFAWVLCRDAAYLVQRYDNYSIWQWRGSPNSYVEFLPITNIT